MAPVIQIQILDDSIYISPCANVFRKGMKQSLQMGKMD